MKPLTTNIKIKGDWSEVLDDCRYTVNKGSRGHTPSAEFKSRILMSEHSPIRDIIVCWDWEHIPYYVANEFTRHHVGIEKFMTTSREDRTGVPRDSRKQTDFVSLRCKANMQSLIDIARKRMCHKATTQAQIYFDDLKTELSKIDEYLGYVLVPNCVYRGGCGELETCGAYKAWLPKNAEYITDLEMRYRNYNDYFFDGGII